MDKSVAIQGLLNGRLDTLATAEKYTVKWEGQASEPPAGTYLRTWLMLGEPSAVGLDNDDDNEVPGVYQIDVVTSLSGWGAAYTVADKIAGTFKRNSQWTVTGVRLIVRKTTIGPALKQDSRYVLPVSVSFKAYATI